MPLSHHGHVKKAARQLSEWAVRVRRGTQLALFSLSAVLGYGVTVFLMHLGSGRTPASAKFAQTIEFDAWTGLLGVNVAVWLMIGIWLWPYGMAWKRDRDHIGVTIPVLIYLLLGIVVYTGLARVQSLIPNPLYLGQLRTTIITVLAFASAMPGVLGVWRLAAVLHTVRARSSSADGLRDADEIVSVLRECRLNLLRCVSGVGVIITGAVAATAGLRAAIRAADLPVSSYPFPATWLVFLGAYFTTILAFIAIPAFISWRVQAMAFVSRIHPIPKDAHLHDTWEAERSRLKRLLHIERTTSEIGANVFGLLAPLLAAILGVFVSAG